MIPREIELLLSLRRQSGSPTLAFFSCLGNACVFPSSGISRLNKGKLVFGSAQLQNEARTEVNQGKINALHFAEGAVEKGLICGEA